MVVVYADAVEPGQFSAGRALLSEEGLWFRSVMSFQFVSCESELFSSRSYVPTR